MKDLKYFGKVQGGKLIIFSRTEMATEISTWEDAFVEINIKHARKRSNPQNRYYWGAMIPIVRQGLKEVGIEMSSEQTHDLLKFRFLKKEFVTSDGEIIESIGSSKELSKLEFNEYIERIQMWSAEYLNVNIPDPNEQTEIEI